jgi:hypothetical protein
VVKLKPNEPGATETVVTFNVTVTTKGVLVAPVAAIEMLPVYVPPASPAGFTETVRGVPPVVPPVVFSESQLPVLEAVAV